MKKTYTPSIEELSRQYGERYFMLETGTSSALVYGDLENLVSTMDAAELDSNIVTICSAAGRPLVFMPCIIAGPDSARVCPQPVGDTYEIRQVDVWHDGESWTYNDSWSLGTFTTAGDPARLGITFYRGRTVTEYDGDVYEICDRATRQPLFAAIPQEV